MLGLSNADDRLLFLTLAFKARPARAVAGWAAILISVAVQAQGGQAPDRTKASALVRQLLAAPNLAMQKKIVQQQASVAHKSVVFGLLSQSQRLMNAGARQAALRANDGALLVADQLDSDLLRGICWHMRAAVLNKASNPDAALLAGQQALKLLRPTKRPGLIAMAMLEVAGAYSESGDVSEAIANYGRVLRLVRKFPGGKGKPLEAEALVALGHICRRQGDIESALDHFRAAIKIADEAGIKTRKASALQGIAYIQSDQGKLREAYDAHSQALRLYRETKNRSGTLGALNNMGIICKKLGRYQEAQAYYSEALDMAVALKQPGAQATLLDNMGSLLRLQGEWRRGVECHERALAILQKVKRPASEAMVRSHLGIVRRTEGAYEEAAYHFRRALKLYRMLGKLQGTATVLNNLGNLYADINQPAKALDAYQESLAIFRKIRDREGVVSALGNLAGYYRSVGANASVQRCLSEAMEEANKTDDPELKIEALLLKADSLDAMPAPGSQQKAFECRQQALALLGGRATPKTAMALMNSAMYCVRNGRFDEAGPLFEKALACARTLNDNQGQVVALSGLGLANLSVEPQRAGVALGYLKEAVKIGERSAETEALSAAQYFAGKAHAALGDAAEMMRSYLAAIKTIEAIRPRQGQPRQVALFGGRHTRVFDYVVRHWAKAGNAARAFEFAERAKARALLAELSSQHVRLRADADDSTLKAERELYARLAAKGLALKREHGKRNPNRKAVEKLEQEVQSIRDEILRLAVRMRERSPAYAAIQYPEPIALDGAQAMLSEDAALVEFVLCDRGAAVILVRKNRAFTCVLDAKEDAVNNAAQAVWRQIREPRSDTEGEKVLARQARFLYEKLLKPIEAQLAGVSHLIIVPDGKLHYVPFEALVTGREASGGRPRYLIERFAVSYAPSATVLHELAGRPREPDSKQRLVLALGDPLYPGERVGAGKLRLAGPGSATVGRLPRLLGTRREVEGIRELAGDHATVLMREAATEDNFRRYAPKASLIHIGAHGMIDDRRSLFSSLVFTLPGLGPDGVAVGHGPLALRPSGKPNDGFLQTYEVLNLKLRADLVVLSACSTGLGELQEGEGIMSLARAFAVAGARSQVLTLWNVNDVSTAQLMGAFYRNLLKKGMPRVYALRAAKLSMLRGQAELPQVARARDVAGVSRLKPRQAGRKREPKPHSNPHHWAAFVMIGCAR